MQQLYWLLKTKMVDLLKKENDSLLIQPSDTLKVLLSTKIPVDAIVTWGSSYVNESMVTNESIPVLKEINAFVIGGTFNWHDVLHIQATKVGPNTVLSQIINLVATTQMSKALIQKFADYIYQRLQVLFVACTKMAAMASYLSCNSLRILLSPLEDMRRNSSWSF
ncbi:copper-transporting ATPase RAN1-like isoform X2 [Cicer arietinum]|uniref:copper-transporting ATPase RAN1-like isoform X2 n=1 Tax=Cicer arietinum TaxID=3827 RepID=UPI003CC68F8D